MTLTATFYCVLVMAVISLTYFIIPDFMISFFTNDEIILTMSREALKIYALLPHDIIII